MIIVVEEEEKEANNLAAWAWPTNRRRKSPAFDFRSNLEVVDWYRLLSPSCFVAISIGKPLVQVPHALNANNTHCKFIVNILST